MYHYLVYNNALSNQILWGATSVLVRMSKKNVIFAQIYFHNALCRIWPYFFFQEPRTFWSFGKNFNIFIPRHFRAFFRYQKWRNISFFRPSREIPKKIVKKLPLLFLKLTFWFYRVVKMEYFRRGRHNCLNFWIT